MDDKARLLLVDDDPLLSRATARLLRSAGYTVSTATTGAEGVRMVREQTPDVVLLDVVLPDIEGLEVCRRIKADRALADVYVILLSGLKTASDEQAKGLEAGADAYIARPIANRELLARVEALMRIQRAERALRDSEEKFRNVIEQSNDGIALADSEGMVIEWNASAVQIFGLERAEVLGRPLWDVQFQVAPEMYKTEAGYAQIKTMLRQLFETQHADWLGELQGSEIQRPDGSHRFVEASIFPIHMGKKFMAGSIIRDITKQKRAEEALKRERDFNSIVLDTVDALVIVLDPEGRIVRFNHACEVCSGYTFEEVEGRKFWDVLLLEEERNAVKAVFADLKARALPSRFENYWVTKDGRERLIAWSNAVLTGEGGTVDYIMGTGIDVTERRRTERALARHAHALTQHAHALMRANEDLERFAYVVAHHLQEPLRTIVSYTQLLAKRQTGQPDPDMEQVRASIVDSALYMRDLLRDLLAYSALDRQVEVSKTVSSEKILAYVLEQLHEMIIESGARMTHDPLPDVRVNPMQFTQVFQALVDNAIKFSRGSSVATPPHIHISAEREADMWVFSVRDNGIGIAPKYTARIFRVFERLHTRQDYPGTGIGLAMCKKIIEQHGGRIWVESELGEGATFYFTLPIEKSDS
jgi:PAS domain S-box-containing protein